MKRLVGFLGWVGVALVVGAVVLRFSQPEWAQWSRATALAGLIVTLLYTLTQWRDIARSLGGRNVKYGSMAATSVVLVLGIVSGINWIASRQNKRWDLTAGGQFSLSDQTRQLLSSLQKPVNIKAFYVASSDQYRDRLQEYEYLSSQVKVEYIDAQTDPLQAESLGIQQVPTFVIQYDGRTERASGVDEQTLTNALKKVIEGRTKKIYFTEGHGERNPTDGEQLGYQAASDALKNDNFEVAPLSLAQTGKIPEDATVIAIVGPKVDLLPTEITALTEFLRRGGKVLLMIDPPEKGTAADTPALIALARDWGITVGNDMVVDASPESQRYGTGPTMPLAKPVSHAITNDFNLYTGFPIARSATPTEGGANGHTAQKFVESSAESWAETDVKGLYATGRVERNAGQGDKPGPVSLAAAVSAPLADAPGAQPNAKPDDVSAPKPESRLVVFGDSDFATNRAIGFSGNRDLFLNAVNWLAQQEDLIAIRPKNPEDRPINMTADQGTMVYLFSMLIVPALLLLGGVVVWWKRR